MCQINGIHFILPDENIYLWNLQIKIKHPG